MEEKDEKIVEIARFANPSEAQTLIALLKAEGIPCYLRNELSSQILAGYADVGGARLEILESDVDRAVDVMEKGGYIRFLKEEDEKPIDQMAGLANHIPFLRKYARETQILILLIMAAICIAFLIYLGSFLSSTK